jgi:type I restriction enzyme, S subunit
MAPSDWPATRLGDVAEIAIGGTPSRSRPEFWAKSPEPEGHPWASIADLSVRKVTQTKERITDLGVRHSNVKPVEPGTVLMSFKLTIGRTAFAGVHLYTNEAIAAFRPRPQLDPEFLYHALPLAALSGDADVAIKGMTLNKAKLVDLPLRLPPLAEQRKIAAILSSVDETIEKTEAVIAQLDVVKKAMLEELLTRGIPGRHSRFKQTEIGEVPAEWEVAILGEACEFLDGQRVPIKASDRASMQGDVPYYGASGVVDWVNAHLFDEPLVLLSEDGANILTRSSPVAFKIAGRSWVNNHAHVLRPLPDWDHDFLVEYLQSIDYADYSTGTAQPKLNKQVCLGIEVPKPSASEQREIGSIVRALDERLAAERVGLRAASDLKASLSFALLTGELRIHVQAGGM